MYEREKEKKGEGEQNVYVLKNDLKRELDYWGETKERNLNREKNQIQRERQNVCFKNLFGGVEDGDKMKKRVSSWCNG